MVAERLLVTTTRIHLILTWLLLVPSWSKFPTTTAMTTAAAKMASSHSVAIIGGGIAGCASARRLAQRLGAERIRITLYDIGRGPGGRASTRTTRKLPHLKINHGAPYADIRSTLGKSLVEDAAEVFCGVSGSLDAITGKFTKHESSDSEQIKYVTGANGQMSEIAAALIRNTTPAIDTRYKTMVRSLSKNRGGQWELLDQDQHVVGSADWLVVAGSGIAHPRWSSTFGGEPPLVAAQQKYSDSLLRKSLTEIAKQQTSPVLAVLVAFSGPRAREWLTLGYNVATIKDSSVLSKVVIQGGEKDNDDAWCSVVLHSTEDFALKNTGVYGASSSAARIGEAASDASREEALVKEMIVALDEIPSVPAVEASPSCDYGPVLHRWGNAFPKGKALPRDLSFVPSSKVAFCGDYVAYDDDVRFGSFESALLSGTAAGDNIANEIAKLCQEEEQ